MEHNNQQPEKQGANEREAPLTGSLADTAQAFKRKGEEETRRLLEEIEQSQHMFGDSSANETQELKSKAQKVLNDLLKEMDQILREEKLPEDYDAETRALAKNAPPIILEEEEKEAIAAAHTERERLDIIDALKERVTDLFSAQPVAIDELEEVIDSTSHTQELADTVKQELVSYIGERYTSKILSSEYRTSLKEVATLLSGSLPGLEHVTLCAEEGRTLNGLIGIRETLGSAESIRRLIEALDLRHELPELRVKPDRALIQLGVKGASFNKASGEPQTSIDVGLEYDDNVTHIGRTFKHTSTKQENGTWKTERSVAHDSFALAVELEHRGVAKQVLQRSLECYEAQNRETSEKPLVDITLQAGKEVGGYAWASYGFGWDQEQMQGHYKHGKFEDAPFQKLLKDFVEAISQKTSRFIDTVLENSPEDTAALEGIAHLKKELDLLVQDAANPAMAENITPQRIALLGKQGPRFIRDDYGHWYTEAGFKTAKQKAEAEDKHLAVAADSPGAIHLGKFALLGTQWYGKIELTSTGPQQGKNLNLFKQRLGV